MVSIIIVNYNTYLYTEKCIYSIYNKTKGTSFEIILVNNSSADRNIQELKITFPGLIIIENSENLGFAKANNIGIKQAKGNYILLLNSDIELINDAISITKNILFQSRNIGVVSAQLQYPDGTLQPTCQSFPSIISELLETSRIHKLLNKNYIAKNHINSRLNLNKSNYCDWVWGTYFMFRKADLVKLPGNGLSEIFFMYGEDMEWCYQMKLAKLKSYYCAEAKVIHYMGQSAYGNNMKKNTAIIKNEILFLRKYKGASYSFVIRMLKGLKYLIQSIKNKSCYQIALIYFSPK